MSVTRRSLLLGAAGLALPLAPSRAADPNRFFRIGSGSSGGIYYPLASLLAAAISNPGSEQDCAVARVCGVPGLIAVAQTSTGSLENLQELAAGTVESAFCQADLAQRAVEEGLEGLPVEAGAGLRVLAYLYPEYLHIVVRRGLGVQRLADLAGLRVSLGPPGSGTHVDALAFFGAQGLGADNIQLQSLSPVAEAAALRNGALDAFLFIGGAPANLVQGLAAEQLITLLPIVGAGEPEVMPGFLPGVIDAGVYQGIGATPTLSTGALWLTTDSLPEELAFAIVRALWSPATMNFLEANDPGLARQISLDRALTGIGVPSLHDGAARFYRDAGLL